MDSNRPGGVGMGKRIGSLVLTFTLVLAARAAAQAAWDSPLLAAPLPVSGFGIHLMDPAGADLGVMGTYRGGPSGVELRLGLAERDRGRDRDDALSVFGGLETQALISRASTNFPLDFAWVAGAGIGAGDGGAIVSVPVGITLGRTLTGTGASFTPYGTPRLIVDGIFGDNRRDRLDLDLAVDLGLDLRFQQGWLVRVAGTVGDREALSIGLVFH